MPLQLILGDKNPDLIRAWEQAFSGIDCVTVRGGNLLLTRADALVSPANSFGFMDGGIDWAISDLFEWKIQDKVQTVIRAKHAGELVVGLAEIVPTGHERFPYLVCAPTMRVPHDVSNTVNSFLAMRATLLAIRQFNAEHPDAIKSVAVPGLATGFGHMPYERCARQMRAAYDEVLGNVSNKYRTLKDAIAVEVALKA